MEIQSFRSPRRARIEIIPLIDIIFFLLATFMMVSLSMVQNRGLAVDLPQSVNSSPLPRDDKTDLTLSVTREGQYALNKRELSLSELENILQTHPDKSSRVFVSADGSAKYQLVIDLLDLARRSGFSKVAIETTNPKSGNE